MRRAKRTTPRRPRMEQNEGRADAEQLEEEMLTGIWQRGSVKRLLSRKPRSPRASPVHHLSVFRITPHCRL